MRDANVTAKRQNLCNKDYIKDRRVTRLYQRWLIVLLGLTTAFDAELLRLCGNILASGIFRHNCACCHDLYHQGNLAESCPHQRETIPSPERIWSTFAQPFFPASESVGKLVRLYQWISLCFTEYFKLSPTHFSYLFAVNAVGMVLVGQLNFFLLGKWTDRQILRHHRTKKNITEKYLIFSVCLNMMGTMGTFKYPSSTPV